MLFWTNFPALVRHERHEAHVPWRSREDL